MASQLVSSTERPAGLVQEGWLVKRSRSLHLWRHRWLSLWDGQGCTQASLCFSPRPRDYIRPSETFSMDKIKNVRLVEDIYFGRPSCFVLEYCEFESTSSVQIRCVGLQAPTKEARDMWISEVCRAMTCSVPRIPSTPSVERNLAPEPETVNVEGGATLEILKSQKPTSARGTPASGQEANNLKDSTERSDDTPKLDAADKSAKSKGKGKGKKGKGPAAPPPALPKGSGKTGGKSLPASQTKVLPFGKRMNLRDSGALPLTARGERQESVFQGLLSTREGRTQEDIDVLQSMFSNRRQGSESPHSGARSGNSPVSTPRSVLPDKEARNCTIVLRRLPLQGLDLVQAIELLQPGPLDQDHMERLAAVLPPPVLMAELNAAASLEGPPLRDVEQMLVPLAGLGRLQERLKVLSLAATLRPQELTLMHQMDCIQLACHQICKSPILKQVLATVLVMFNYVNFGRVSRSEARAFDISSLLHLNEFRAGDGPFPKFNALHYIATRLLSDGTISSAKSLQDELGQVSAASAVCLVSIGAYIETLRLEICKVQEEQQANSQVYGGKLQPPKLEIPVRPSSLEDVFLFAPRGVPAETGLQPLETPESEPPFPSPHLLFPAPPSGFWSLLAWIRRSTAQAGPPSDISEQARYMPRFAPKPHCLWLSFPDLCISARRVALSLSAPGLVCYCEVSEEGQLQSEVCCLPLTAAWVSKLESASSPLSERCFEVTVPTTPGSCGESTRMTLSAENSRVAWRWQRAFEKTSKDPSVGWLQVPNSFGVMCWRWAVHHVADSHDSLAAGGSRWLVWYMTPEDLLLGEPPRGGCRLGQHAEVFVEDYEAFTFHLSGVSPKDGPEATCSIRLRARTASEMETWGSLLRGALQSTVNQDEIETPPRKSPVVGARPHPSAKASPVKVPALKLSLPSSDHAQPARSLQKISRSPKVRLELPHTEFQKNTITPREVLKATPRIEEVSEESETISTESDTCSERSSGTHSTTSLSPLSERQDLMAPPPELPEPTEAIVESDEETTTYSRMSQLAEEAEESAQRLSSTLGTALQNGSKLLRYLDQGMGGSEDTKEELPRRIQTALHTISKFTSMLGGAIIEIEKHQSKLQKRDSTTEVASRKMESFGFAHCRRRRPKGMCDEEASRLLARDAVQRAVLRACNSESFVPRRIWASSPRSARSSDSSRSSLSTGRSSRNTISAMARPLRFRSAEDKVPAVHKLQ